MRVPSPMRIATLTLLVGGLACARNSANEEVGAARDSTAAARDTMTTEVPDSAKPNQTKSGVTDPKTGESTVPNVTETRPDQGEPVTSKGDTLNPSVDSTAHPGADTSMTDQTVVDTSMTPAGADSSAADTSTAR